MSEAVLTVLKFCFLALLYLFLWRVVRVVVAETKAPTTPSAPPSPRARKAKPDRKQLTLHVLEPATRRGETFAVADEVTVGRAGGCTLVLADDTFVSQVHGRVFRRDGDTLVEDLGSKNGTFVNGTRITAPTKVRKGDRVQFGQTVAEVTK